MLHPLRSGLTMLGILIGVAAVVTITALGEGARASIAAKIEGMGANVLYVFPRSTKASGARSTGGGRLTEMDGLAITREASSAATSPTPSAMSGTQSAPPARLAGSSGTGRQLSHH